VLEPALELCGGCWCLEELGEGGGDVVLIVGMDQIDQAVPTRSAARRPRIRSADGLW
jgi:hypothetical protein